MPVKKQPHNWNFEHTYASLPDHFFQHVHPAKPPAPELALFNKELARALGLEWLSNKPGVIANQLSGKELPENAHPVAQAYAGHQFGYFTMLGDGRAILLGEQITPDNNRFDIQLKGAGQTNYSRRGDGRATFYSMLREYLMSEAMHGLGIPTTRSLAVVKTGFPVYRETESEGAVLTRVAASHIRTGTFEYVRQFGSTDDLQQLVSYTIQRHFPQIENQKNQPLALLGLVMEKQLALIVDWLRVGFIHGVMNTDNMSIPGETIDYGPCAFMNKYNPGNVFSSIDQNGRYAFGKQASIGLWNTSVFAGTLLHLIHPDEKTAVQMAQEMLNTYQEKYKQRWYRMMFNKLGILYPEADDKELADDLMGMLTRFQPDYTNFFVSLERGKEGNEAIFASERFRLWHSKWQSRIEKNQSKQEAKQRMRQNNPVVIPRNHLVEGALNDAINGNMSTFNQLLDALRDPYSPPSTEGFQTVPAGFDDQYQTFCGT
ncbi:MAG: YdiU family protein [Prolixibacteraceae bacterium]|nr:YdiU family protein [Prolixibacteraceae bacterium]